MCRNNKNVLIAALLFVHVRFSGHGILIGRPRGREAITEEAGYNTYSFSKKPFGSFTSHVVTEGLKYLAVSTAAWSQFISIAVSIDAW